MHGLLLYHKMNHLLCSFAYFSGDKGKGGSPILIRRWDVRFLCCLFFPLTKMHGVTTKLSTSSDISKACKSPFFLPEMSPMANFFEFVDVPSLRIHIELISFHANTSSNTLLTEIACGALNYTFKTVSCPFHTKRTSAGKIDWSATVGQLIMTPAAEEGMPLTCRFEL